MSVGWQGKDGHNIHDFSLTQRDFMDLPLTGRTTDPVTGEVTQEVRSGPDTRGITQTITTDFTRDGNGFVTQAVVTFAGGGVTRTETWTYTLDANGEVASESVTRT
jgi:hypothetical protein